MTTRKSIYLNMADAYIRDLNKNADDIEVAVAELKTAELALATAEQRLNALRGNRKFQIVELKGVRDILRKLEDADTAMARDNEDGTLE